MGRSSWQETDRMLLNQVADWDDATACERFDATYRPMVRAWGRRLGFVGDELDELCQIVMIEVLKKMKGFRYDPLRSFRGWIRQILQWRAMQLLRARRRAALPLVDPEAVMDSRVRAELITTRPLGDDPLMSLFDEIQGAVRRRVHPENWRIFWMIRVEQRPIAEVAELFGKSYVAAYRNQERIARMLREEARRRLDPPSPDTA